MPKGFLLAASAATMAMASPAFAASVFTENFESAPYQFTIVGNAQVTNGYAYQPCCGTTGSSASLANHFVAFGGGNNPSGVIFAPISTVLGRSYTISFDYAALGATGEFDPLTLSVNNTSVRFQSAADNNLDTTYKMGSYTFTAMSPSTVFSFQSQGVPNVDAILDNVSLSGGVPEPATWGLMILGFGGIGGMLRRRSSKVSYAL